MSAASLKANLDEVQTRLAALEASSPANAGSTRVYRTTTQSIASGTSVPVSFDTIRFDYGGQWSSGTPTRLTAKAAGVYMIGGCVEWLFNTTGSRQISLRVNAVTYIANQLIPPNGVNTPSQCITTIYQMAANDYVEIEAYQASGGALNLTTQSAYAPEFWLHRLR